MPQVFRWRIPVLLPLFALLVLVAAACGQKAAPSPSGSDGGEGTPREEVAIAILPPGDIPQEVLSFVEEHQAAPGVYQTVAGKATYILIAWGEKPHSGYQLTVEKAEPTEEGLAIHIHLKEPSPDAITLPAVSYPLALLQVTPAGTYPVDIRFRGGIFYQNNAFKVEKPVPYEKVGDEVHIKGQARVWEATFHVRLEDGHDVLLDEVLQVSEGAPMWSPFDVTLPLEKRPTSPYGTLFIFYDSPKDGEVADQLIIPVRFTSWSHP